jgi:PAS domain-containing protein
VAFLNCFEREAPLPHKDTQSKSAARTAVASDTQLHVALDNMPGALVYADDDLRIVFCNERFREMYAAPPALLQPGRYCGRVVLQERDGLRVLVDPSRQDRTEAIKILEEVLVQLRS